MGGYGVTTSSVPAGSTAFTVDIFKTNPCRAVCGMYIFTSNFLNCNQVILEYNIAFFLLSKVSQAAESPPAIHQCLYQTYELAFSWKWVQRLAVCWIQRIFNNQFENEGSKI